MRFFSAAIPFSLTALVACDPSGRGAPQGSGQTGSIGPSNDECTVAADCDQQLAAEVAGLREPAPASVSFSNAECINLGVVGGASGPACACHVAGGDGTLAVGPVGGDCFALGRGGDCLWPGSDFDGCQVGEASACDATCADLEQRLADDAAKKLDAESVYDTCRENTCHGVVRIGERCFADHSYTEGRSYDCPLGGEAILAAHDADAMPAEKPLLPETRTSYVEGTDGFVQLISSSQFVGTAPSYSGFGAMAQFAIIKGQSGMFGDVIDPLDGVDDCGVSKDAGVGAAANIDFYDAADVELLDGKTVRPLTLSQASHDDFYQYIAELSDQGVAPRFGQSYGVKVAGGTFGAAFQSSTLRLPEDLVLNELQQSAHFEQKDLRLTWTGQGAQPLYVSMLVSKSPTDLNNAYQIECLIKDDGEFVIPESVLAAAPSGFVSATFTREDRRIEQSGGHA
ncbi:MAG TPA: hypothetical protein VNG33_03970, partial [Polyangiaceae bacterium]|nr:hypothetical protein [Polyangiaceae bacterium]